MRRCIQKVGLYSIIPVVPFLCCRFLESEQWKGSVKTENGVTIIENPRQPIYQAASPEFDIELTIGESYSPGDISFVRIASIIVDQSENIYALDSRESNIKVFSREGQFKKIIGRQGPGPGELATPVYMDFISSTEIMVLDARIRRLTVYNMEGEYQRSMSTASYSMGEIKIDSMGNIFSIIQSTKDGLRRYELQKFDSSLNFMRIYDSSFIKDEENLSLFLAGPSFAITQDGIVWYGCPDRRYEIKGYNSDGLLVKRIYKNDVLTRIPSAEVEAATKGIPQGLKVYIPEYYAPYYAIDDDKNGRLIVLSRIISRENIYFFDIFDKAGRLVETKRFAPGHKASCFRWKNNKLYVVEEDSSGLPVIKVYRVNWAKR